MKKILLSLGAALLACSAVNAQLYFHEDFENGGTNWTTVDGDNDGNNWDFHDYASGDGQGMVAISASWNSTDGALTPNNYLISPQITLGTTGLQLMYKVKGQDPSYSQEHYAVYVTTANDTATINASTPVFEETLPTQTTDYLIRTVDLSAFSGQSVYITFRHYNVTDMFVLNIDDIFVGQTTDVALEAITTPSSNLVGNVDISGTVKNTGTEEITSLDVTYDDGSGPVTATINGLSIMAGDEYTFTCPTPYNLASADPYTINVCATTTNDAESTNNCLDKTISGASQLVDKYVVVEEKTGTWCGWCPYGTVALDDLHDNYPKAIEIAIHNADPMAITSYDAASENFPGFSGYPYSAIDRVIGDHAAYSVQHFNERKTLTPLASVSFDEASVSGTTITVTPKVSMVSNLNGDYRLAVVIIEDSVTGTGSAWLQHNYFPQQGVDLVDGNGVNWKDLTATVDQSALFGGYNHVARLLANDQINGDAGSLPTALVDGQSYTYTYTLQGDASWDGNNLHVIAMLVNNTTGEILNAKQTVLTGDLAVSDQSLATMDLKVYPNPANAQTVVSFDVASKSDVNVAVYDMTGKVVTSHHLGSVVGAQNVALNTTQLQAGFYLVKVKTNNSVQTKRISVVH